jgi:hypothetical protein
MDAKPFLIAMSFLTISLVAAPPAAAASDCTTDGVDPCTFTCDDGDEVYIHVWGTDFIPSSGNGNAVCGTAHPHCSFTTSTPPYECEAHAGTLTDSVGTCTLVTGRQATCWSTP